MILETAEPGRRYKFSHDQLDRLDSNCTDGIIRLGVIQKEMKTNAEEAAHLQFLTFLSPNDLLLSSPY